MSDKKMLAERLRQFYHLEPLPIEGGLFRQTYRSEEWLEAGELPERFAVGHPYGTAIVYLLNGEPDCFSALHVLPTDEVYHFYLGDPVEMLLLFPDGGSRRVILGPDVFNGQRVQFTAPRGAWQGSHLAQGGEYALIGTTMAPGYVDGDYVGGERQELIERYPAEAELIRKLTRVEGEGV